MSVNKQIILGYVAKDPDVKTNGKGTTFAKVSIPTNDGFGDNKKTNWHNILFIGKTAEAVSKYVKKGSQIYVEGHTQHDSYEKDGRKMYTTTIVASSFSFAGGTQENGESKQKAGNNEENNIYTDDVPF